MSEYVGRRRAVPLAPPSPREGLVEVFRRRYLLKLLMKREISARYQGSFLGMIWSYINPLSNLVLYWLVMGVIMGLHKNVPNFGIHLFNGLVVVSFFTETFNSGTRSIVRNKSIVKKMAMPREMFPVASMLVSLYHAFPQLVILIAICVWQGWTPDLTGMAALVIAMVFIMVIGTSAALLFSAANVYWQDFGNMVNVMLHFVRFSVPMMYPYSMVDGRFGSFAQYYLWNPLAEAVVLMQRAFWVGTTDDPAATMARETPSHLLERGLIFLLIGIVFLVFAQMVFTKLDRGIPERLQ